MPRRALAKNNDSVGQYSGETFASQFRLKNVNPKMPPSEIASGFVTDCRC
jgi:hypothetical protein